MLRRNKVKPVQNIRLENGQSARVTVLGIVDLPDRYWIVGQTPDGRVVKGKPIQRVA